MALVLISLFILLAVLWRVLLQYKITGDHGLRPAKISSPFIVKLTSVLFGISLFAIFVTVISESIADRALLSLPNSLFEWVGLVLGIFGISISVYSQYQMGREWRIGVDENENTDLVKHGIYAYIRNPIYTGVAVFCAGLVLLNPGLLMMIACGSVCISIELHVRLVEEPHLQRMHGIRFSEYKATTGRYLPSWRGKESQL